MQKRMSKTIREVVLKKPSFWIYQVLGWIGFYAFMITKEVIGIFQKNDDLIFNPERYFSITNYIITGFVFTLVLRYIYQYLFLKQYTILRNLGYISLLTIIVTLLHTLITHFTYKIVVDPKATYSTLYYLLMTFFNLQVFFGWSILYFAIKYWYQWNFEKDRAEKASLLAQSAQLQMLRYQLNPHFLFNSLNSIKALVNEDQQASRAMISELSEFLRYSLVTKNYSEVPLSNELEAIKHYFSIEKKRFEEKLDVTYDISIEAEKYPVLSFILHPLVENAVKYGMMTSALPLKISISAKVVEGNLTVKVKNTGKWVEGKSSNTESGTGTGLANIRARLENAYPNRYFLDFGQIDDCVIATIKILK